jgi:hypothetical protein
VNFRLKEALRRKVTAHNRLVRLSTWGAALGVILMWGFLYFVANWLPLLFLTIVKGVDAEIPPNLHRWILLIFVVWIVVGLIDRLVRKSEPNPSESSAAATTFKFLMLPPRATFAVWENSRNSIALSEHELEIASNFIERLFRIGKLEVQSIPVELPADDSRDRILTALRTTQLIREREIQKTTFLALTHPERVAEFVQA